jgi:hypothetical protein
MMLFFMALFFNGSITIHRRDRFSPTVAYRQQLTGIRGFGAPSADTFYASAWPDICAAANRLQPQNMLMGKRNHSANAYPTLVAASLVFLYGRRFGYARQT